MLKNAKTFELMDKIFLYLSLQWDANDPVSVQMQGLVRDFWVCIHKEWI